MDNIEQLIRNQLKAAEQAPPDDVWNTIEGRLSAFPATSPAASTTRPSSHRGLAVASGALAVVAIVAVLFFTTTRQQTQEQTQPVASLSQQTAEEITIANENNATVEVEAPNAKDSQSPTTVKATIQAAENVGEEKRNTYMATSVAVLPRTTSSTTSTEEATTKPTIVEQPSTKQTQPDILADDLENPANTPLISDDKDTTSHIQLDVSIIIPNLLTPNGDGYNDCWTLPDLEQYGTVQVQIYTAKSQRVFSSPDYHNDFCGYDLPDGNYFYVLNFRDLKTSRRGVLVIKR